MDPGARRKSRSVALFLSLSVWIYSQALGGEPLSMQETTPAARPRCPAPAHQAADTPSEDAAPPKPPALRPGRVVLVGEANAA